MWRLIRISLLLIVLAAVVLHTWLDRAMTTDWDSTLWVGVFPIPGDDSPATKQYVDRLTREDFAGVEQFFQSEATKYGIRLREPVRIEVYPPSDTLPPMLEPGAGPLASAWWSLKLRWFAREASDVPGRPPSHIRVFAVYHDPEVSSRLPHSHGLQKGLVGVVHLFASNAQRRTNEVVLAHEVMHTLGASDKYDPANDAPKYPDGYGDPEQKPLYPQRYAEIMAGRVALSENEYEMAASLRQAVVGKKTAAEIGWLDE